MRYQVYMKGLKSAVIIQLAVSGILMSSVSCLSCGPVSDLRDFSGTDLFPPVISGIYAADCRTVELSFNEAVEIDGTPQLTPEAGRLSVSEEEKKIIISMSADQTAGVKYTLSGSVRDRTGNSMSFLMPFYGFNPDIPGILINELTTQGSSTHPDVVELYVTEAGNLAGVQLLEGTSDYPEQGICFPSCRVEKDEYILIHFKPQGIEEELDESGDSVTVSGGIDSSAEARDFWIEGGSGLSGNNGVIAVYSAPGGSLIDGLLYSNRTSSSDTDYRGFGSSRMLDKAEQLCRQGGWTAGGSDGLPRPEDAVNPDDSTATRSICRASVPSDSNSAEDWHIVPTSGYSFGEINTDEVYRP